MKTYFKITKNEKILVKKIWEMFLKHESFAHIKVVFYTWLTDDNSEIYLRKEDGVWTYLLVDTGNPLVGKTIVDIKSVLYAN